MILRIYKDGKVTGDKRAFVSPFRGDFNEYDLEGLSKEEVDLLMQKTYTKENITEPDSV